MTPLHMRGIINSSIATVLCLLPLVASEAGQPPSDLGLLVNSQGTLIRHGGPYRGIGVNYYDAFLRTLRDSHDDSYKEGFAQLGAHGIPFARMAACGYTGEDLQLYLTDKDAYFQRLDGVIQTAEKSKVGLIASLFWRIAAVSEAMHEPRASWGDANSATRRFMREYTHDVVSRYAKSDAIWGWEFSCELSLPADRRPGEANPDRALSFATFESAATDFARVVRTIDPHRIVTTGNSLPRPSAYHNARGGRVAPDTEEEFARILLRDNPDPFSPISIHAAPAGVDHYFADHKVSYLELLQTCARIGAQVGKPVYLEEFVPVPGKSSAFANVNERDYFTHELADVEASNVPIASIWVYDRKLVPDRSNVTFHNERSYMLQMIAAFDRTVDKETAN